MAVKGTGILQARDGARYVLRLPVTYAWKDETNTWQRRAGRTRDISTRSAFIFASEPPPFGTALKIEAYLPWDPDRSPASIFGQGRVVRAEPRRELGARGFAVGKLRLVLRRGEHLV